MSAYTQAIDLHITQTLQLRGYVTPEMLAGVDEPDASEMLRHYVSAHAGTQPEVVFDGVKLAVRTVEAPAESKTWIAPMDSSFSSSAPDGPFSKWLWALPLSFGIFGGVVGWLAVRDKNRTGGRAMLIVGALVSVAMGLGMVGLTNGASGGESVDWPPSPYGYASLYYFGTST